MSGMKDKESGDWAPSRAPYMDIGRFRIALSTTCSEVVWIRDMDSSEAGQPYDLGNFEEAIGNFCKENF